MRRGSWVLVAGLLATVPACAHRGGAVAGAPQPAAAVRLDVTNNNGMIMEIFIVASGAARRMGLVAPGTVGHFVVPQSMLGNGPIEVEAMAPAQMIRSGRLLLAAGQTIDFKIGTTQVNSTATVW
jgi:hypothetical protein